MASGPPIVSDSGFGRYLASVAERDIDLLLMEEFHASDEFVDWFCGEAGLRGALPAGAWHSLSDTDGESDLVLRVIKDGKRVGILIENKIGAPEQDLQAERYHLRGIKSREQGKLDDYRTVICAPARYLESLSNASTYQYRVSYEQIADWFSRQSGRRAAWRHHILLEAIDQGRRGYTMAVNAVNTAFHLAYWEHIQKRHPRIHMARPKNRGSYSSWVILKGHDFPKAVNMHHKFDQQVMEIGFAGHNVDEVLAVNSAWPDDIMLVQKGKTASLAIQVPPIDMKIEFVKQIPSIEEALAAAYRLMPYSSLLNDKTSR
jgi:PD-(D/E)XK nuclease superfamily protein